MIKIFLLAVGMFALGLDAYAIAGLIPAMSTSFHVGAAEIGQSVTIFTLFYALSAPVFSTLLVGRPIRQILMVAMIIFSLANIASALAQTLTQLLIARAIAGVGAGLYSPMAAAAAVSLLPSEQKGRAIGFMLGGMSAGTVIGVPVGLLIAEYSDWSNTFWFVSLLGVMTLGSIYFQFPSFMTKAPPSLKERIAMLMNRRVAYTVGVSLLMSISSLGLYTYLAPVVENSIGISAISPYLWAWGVGGIIGSFMIGSLIDYTGRPRELLVGIIAVMALSLFMLPWLLPYALWGFIPLVLWGAMGWSSQAPQQHSLLTLQPEYGSVAVALNSSANYLGSAIGSALGGLAIYLGLMPEYLPFAAGVIAMLACLGQLLIITNTRSETQIISSVV